LISILSLTDFSVAFFFKPHFQIIQKYYELLLNSNQNSCDLRRLNSNLSELNFTDSENVIQSSGNSNKIDESLGDLQNTKNEIRNGRCDIARERYVMEVGIELRKFEFLGYQLFRTPFKQLIDRAPCSTYEIYKRNVEGTSLQCRKCQFRNMNVHLERIYDYYCGNTFANLLLNQKSCLEKLHLIYNESECANITHFSKGYNNNSPSERVTSDQSSQRCNFAKWYFKCGITESFHETCPQTAKNVQNYFEILINANNSGCHLRQATIIDRNEIVSGRLIRQLTADRNETVSGQSFCINPLHLLFKQPFAITVTIDPYHCDSEY
uniref:Uncharacterized protein n=1 Tax=Elaeophora elaphi TaxID=1147741 RepID=A0A0R3RR27_9BILA